ncbi:MAG: ribonuclease E/G [Henriciella sp.]|nr:ribonuclease E/G [Henriciella sp.]
MADQTAHSWRARLPAGVSAGLLSKIVTHDAPGEFRAAALDGEGKVWRLFQRRWQGLFDVANVGDVVNARLRHKDRSQGGTFAELESGAPVLVTGQLPDNISEGAQVRARIQAEARRDKLARATWTEDPIQGVDPYDVWAASLPVQSELETVPDPATVETAFDIAMEPSVTLPEGGQIHLERTRALTAIDVDTSGRQGRGSAGARALSINREAAIETARQCALRDLGGLIVLDCVAPLNRSSGAEVSKAFRSAFQSVSSRGLDVIAPSRFGLLQAAIAWGRAPIDDRMLGSDGQPTPETRLLALLRQVDREASAKGAALFRIDLSPAVFDIYCRRQEVCDSVLRDRFGGRVQIARSSDESDAVRVR